MAGFSTSSPRSRLTQNGLLAQFRVSWLEAMIDWFTGRLGDIDPIQWRWKAISMASNLEKTKRAYELFKQGDIPTLVKEFVDDTCTWISPGPQDPLPWAGHFRGKQEVANFFARVAQNLEFIEFAPTEMIEQGDTVMVIGRSTARSKKTGKTMREDWAHVFKFNQGRLVFFKNTQIRRL